MGKAAVEGMRQGIELIKNLVEETQKNEKVQEGFGRLKNIMGEMQKSIQNRLNNRNNNFIFEPGHVNFDTEDEQLFREITDNERATRPEIIVHAEVLEGIRVIGGTVDDVSDAEVITKTWNR